jgi:glycosyltransferase involved in cell wall biosynthesis
MLAGTDDAHCISFAGPFSMTQYSLPLVTIVTPSFNQAPFLRAAVESVLAQDYPAVEYLVMDGGSTDGSVDILKEFTGRLTWESGRDAGQADALAKGFARARGAILGWLNADDLMFPGALTQVAAHLRAHPDVALVYGDAVYVDVEGRALMPARQVRPFDLKRLRYWSDYIVQPSAFFRRAAYEEVGGLDTSLHWALDYDLWLKLGARHRVDYLRRVWSGYRIQGDSKTVTGSFKRIAEVEAMARRHGLGLPADFRVEKAALHVKEARRALAAGAPRTALAALAAGIATILSSWRALGRCCSWPLWRDILRNRAALRRDRGAAAERETLGRLL